MTDNVEYRIDLCCVAKNESLTIKDWVDYHRGIGIHHIWIYDNNDPEDMSLDNILEEDVKNGFVTILTKYKGAKSFQMKAYNEFIDEHRLTNEYDYVGFIDCDEYFTINKDKYRNVSDYFNRVEENCSYIGALFVNWEVYGDNGEYYYRDEPVVDRFPKPSVKSPDDLVNKRIKTFVRAGRIGKFGGQPHNALVQGITYNTDFEPISPYSPFNVKYTYNNAKIRHYVTKSLEEYLIRKFNGDCPDTQRISPYSIEYYWMENEKRPGWETVLRLLCEKLNITYNKEWEREN